MPTPNELHRTAMALAARALAARSDGEFRESGRLLREAFENEIKVADYVRFRIADEPTRSIILKSACHLALDLGEYREVERLAATGLAGNPAPAMLDEFRRLLGAAVFHAHLRERGETLTNEEAAILFQGGAFHGGFAPKPLFTTKADVAQSLVLRTGERLSSVPFRRRGRVPSETHGHFDLYLGSSTNGSFGLTLKLGQPGSRPGDFVYAPPSRVFLEMAECLDLYDKQPQALMSRIEDPSYRENFEWLARELLPDGKSLRHVGVTVNNAGNLREFVMTRQRQAAVLSTVPVPRRVVNSRRTERTPTEYTGILNFGNDQRGASVLKVEQGSEVSPSIHVGPALDDIVRSYWKRLVVVKVRWDHGKAHLESLDPQPDT